MNIKELLISAINELDLEDIIIENTISKKLEKIEEILTSDKFITNVIMKVSVIFAISRKSNYNANDTEFIEWFKDYDFRDEIIWEAQKLINQEFNN